MPIPDPTPTKQGLPPIVDREVRVLVLGSLPGDASLSAQAYYAHPRNAFWPIMAALLQVRFDIDWPQRYATLLTHGIGLWDVIGRAERQGSLDTRLRRIEANSLPALLADLPALRAVAFNGGTAARLGLPQVPAGIASLALPSTSPAHTLKLVDKIEAWRALEPWLVPPSGR
ncbi:DNA-deoxyinosine glycosylase [Chitiniphilus shinanonensis]|uniref:DNA-deoxyinosine glycosylase n=1 Tax=Chitiniphilus shinanonensis TaxID=553088 RepID=UPI0030409F02